MLSRKIILQKFNPPILPPQSLALADWQRQNKHFKPPFWLGGRLSGPASLKQFTLKNQNQSMVFAPSPKCLFFLDFKLKKPFKWKTASPLLRAGDSLSVYIPSMIKPLKPNSLVRADNIVLCSINQKKRPLPAPPQPIWSDKWLNFLSCVHKTMQHMGFAPVETPVLAACPGTEPDLEVFKTIKHQNGQSQKRFLITSPEISLKKLLCRGLTHIYEIKQCFRNNEHGPLNSCEFYLLEWYRAYSSFEACMEDAAVFLKNMAKKYNFPLPRVQKISVQSLFKKYLNMSLTPYSSKKDFTRQLKKMGVPIPTNAGINDLFHLLFLNGIENKWNTNTPVIVYNYPPFARANARIGAQGWARRFEVFWKGIELANAFDEIISPQEQKTIFQQDTALRRRTKKTCVPLDSQLLADMKIGMPPSTGAAVGLDRLFLIFNKLSNIKQIRNNFEEE